MGYLKTQGWKWLVTGSACAAPAASSTRYLRSEEEST
nr:MAG TPA: hypothetical protein [Caudoviricetes sp.]